MMQRRIMSIFCKKVMKPILSISALLLLALWSYSEVLAGGNGRAVHDQNVKDAFLLRYVVNTGSGKNVYVTKDGIYRKTIGISHSSICIPHSDFKSYQYLTIKANPEYATRIHILKRTPKKDKERVQYSDYIGESFLVRKGLRLDIAIPEDARFIVILDKVDGHKNTPDSVILYKADALYNKEWSGTKSSSQLNNTVYSQRFLHWNIGHFSNGQTPYSSITDSIYNVRYDGFVHFIDTYCKDFCFLLNEYDETFATVKGNPVRTADVLFGGRKPYKEFPRNGSSGYNKLAAFWGDGFEEYKYGIFESLKGVKNRNGTLQYGIGYVISKYSIGGKPLYVMSFHVPNKIKRSEFESLCKEIVEICTEFDNCVLVGDFNRVLKEDFSVLTKAGFIVLNDNSVTYPEKDYILDWVLYKCNDMKLSDFRVYREAVDGMGNLLSDHLPLSFAITYKGN